MRILFIDCDTLRPDHLGCYGYPRATSPNIDAVAQDGVRFSEYYCSDAPCLPSRAALMTGRFGFHTGVVGHGGTAADIRPDGAARRMRDFNSRDNLPAILERSGLYTASISTFAERHGAWWFNAGFNEMHNMGTAGMESAQQITPRALQWLRENQSREDWFLHVHFWDPHTPYRAPAEFGNPFESEPLPVAWATEEMIARHRAMPGPHSAWELGMYDDNESPAWPRCIGQVRNVADFKFNLDQYDCGIAWMDKHIGLLLDELRRQGLYEDTAVIITADHGENLGEMGIYSEHATADVCTARIPMIVKWPGAARNAVCTGMYYNLDLLPTLKELMGSRFPADDDWELFRPHAADRYDGESYAPALFSPAEGTGREYLVLSQCAHVCQRGVRFGPWLYLRTYHDGYHLFPDEMLFNVEEDPAEMEDMAARCPEVCWHGAHYLERWLSENMKKQAPECQIDPLWTVIAEGGPHHAKGHLARYCARLEATGRSAAAAALAGRHPRENVPGYEKEDPQ